MDASGPPETMGISIQHTTGIMQAFLWLQRRSPVRCRDVSFQKKKRGSRLFLRHVSSGCYEAKVTLFGQPNVFDTARSLYEYIR